MEKFSCTLNKRKNYYGEYVIRGYINGKYDEESTYYTDDWEDAVRTFYDICKTMKIEPHNEGNRYWGGDTSRYVVTDAISTYYIEWVDTKARTNGKPKSEYWHIDQIKADSPKRALLKFSHNPEIADLDKWGCQIYNVYTNDKTFTNCSGYLHEIVHKPKNELGIYKNNLRTDSKVKDSIIPIGSKERSEALQKKQIEEIKSIDIERVLNNHPEYDSYDNGYTVNDYTFFKNEDGFAAVSNKSGEVFMDKEFYKVRNEVLGDLRSKWWRESHLVREVKDSESKYLTEEEIDACRQIKEITEEQLKKGPVKIGQYKFVYEPSGEYKSDFYVTNYDTGEVISSKSLDALKKAIKYNIYLDAKYRSDRIDREVKDSEDDKYEIRKEKGHYVIYKNGKFLCSADTYDEAEEEIEKDKSGVKDSFKNVIKNKADPDVGIFNDYYEFEVYSDLTNKPIDEDDVWMTPSGEYCSFDEAVELFKNKYETAENHFNEDYEYYDQEDVLEEAGFRAVSEDELAESIRSEMELDSDPDAGEPDDRIDFNDKKKVKDGIDVTYAGVDKNGITGLIKFDLYSDISRKKFGDNDEVWYDEDGDQKFMTFDEAVEYMSEIFEEDEVDISKLSKEEIKRILIEDYGFKKFDSPNDGDIYDMAWEQVDKEYDDGPDY